MSNHDPSLQLLAELDFDVTAIEVEVTALAERRRKIAEQLRQYGLVDRAHRPALELARVHNVVVPQLEFCTAGVYRIADDAGRDCLGGIQNEGKYFDGEDIAPCGLRIPAYQIGVEGRVIPAGDTFDNLEVAEMVAVQGDELWKFAVENGINLDPDLTRLTDEPEIQVFTTALR
jgi:hypothetical protein